ncbi:MAG: hypothetical protein GY915_08605 [bacterium]|nr:hypothetical protein [bacterium]
MTWSEGVTREILSCLEEGLNVPIAAQIPPETKPPYVVVNLEFIQDPHALTGTGEASFVCTILTQSKGFWEGRQIAENVQSLLEKNPLVLEEVKGQARAHLTQEKSRIESDRVTRKIEQTYRLRLKRN